MSVLEESALRTLPVPLLLVDGGDAGIRSINRAATAAIGYDLAARERLSLLSIFPRVSPLELARLLDTTVVGHRPPQQWLMRRPDGSVALTEVLIARHEVEQRNEWVFVLRDLSRATDRHERLREAIGQLREAIIVTRPLARADDAIECLFVNSAFETLTGWTGDELNVVSLSVLDGPDTSLDTVRRIHEAMADGRPSCSELLCYRRDGMPFWVEIEAVPIRLDGIISHWIVEHRDVTGRRRLEEQIFRAQKLDAVGRLASGVAHDFNNVLTAIGGFTDMLLDQLTAGSSQRDEALQIKLGADRAVALTRQLLVFGREQAARPSHVDMNTAIVAMERLMRRVISERINIRTVLTTSLPTVFLDRNQIEQVLLNLVMNASDALPDGGTVTVETSVMTVDESSPTVSMPPGRYVVLAVEDGGTGMTADVRERMFEPFFTTKATGSGLGLSVVHGIVRRAGGHVLVDSAVGRGSTLRVVLPASGGRPDAAPVDKAAEPLGGSETVLVVEDDAAVRHVTRSMLVRRGYTVLAARDSEDAERVASEHAGVIDLLLCDMVLPRRSGRYVAERLLLRRPQLKVLFMSGYSEDVVLDSQLLAPRDAMLEKPFSDASLARRVRAALDRPT